MGGDPPPSPPAAPVVGHVLRWARDPFTVGSWANETVGGVAQTSWVLPDRIPTPARVERRRR